MGVIQFIQIGRVADGPQYGLRVRPAKNPGELTQSRSHLHKVRGNLRSRTLLLSSKLTRFLPLFTFVIDHLGRQYDRSIPRLASTPAREMG